MRVLVTGSRGLIGAALTNALAHRHDVVEFDVAYDQTDRRYGNVLDPSLLHQAMNGVDGVVHLAAVSRVLLGQQNPVGCVSTNVVGTRQVLDATCRCATNPWFILASSREVYGNASFLPCDETAKLSPLNCYAVTKVAQEALVAADRHRLRSSAILRLSTVYGHANDHFDRVIPAFVAGVASGAKLRIEGTDTTLDCTFIDDVVDGILKVIAAFSRDDCHFPPVQLTTGIPTTLSELAEIVGQLLSEPVHYDIAPPRAFDVTKFWGKPDLAQKIFGWTPETSLSVGLSVYIRRLGIQLNQRV